MPKSGKELIEKTRDLIESTVSKISDNILIYNILSLKDIL